MLEDLHAGITPSSASGDYSDVTVISPYGVIPWPKVSCLNDEEALATISSAAPLGGVWGFVVAGLGGVFSGLLGAGCDGPVAADAFEITGKEIREKLAGLPFYNRPNKAPYLGSNSPAGCDS